MKTQDSLSVVLPVHNGARQLAERVGMLLEFLPEMTTNFELLILDNGSTDQSEEVAYELAHDFPQLRVTRHPQRQAEQGVIRTGLQHTSGELVIIYNERTRIRPHELRRMWALRNNQQPEIARPDTRPDTQQPSSLVERLASWASRVQQEQPRGTTAGGMQMIRRSAIAQLESEPAELGKAPARSSRRPRRATASH